MSIATYPTKFVGKLPLTLSGNGSIPSALSSSLAIMMGLNHVCYLSMAGRFSMMKLLYHVMAWM
jgi:hypothetical protein